MVNRLAIDPGDVHVGYAFDYEGEIMTGECSPAAACDGVITLMTRNAIDELVIEEWVLYPEERTNQTWKPMLTSQLIGALKHIAHMFRVPVVEQGAAIKKPTRKQLPARGIEQQGQTIHARDAELHLWYRKLNKDGTP